MLLQEKRYPWLSSLSVAERAELESRISELYLETSSKEQAELQTNPLGAFPPGRISSFQLRLMMGLIKRVSNPDPDIFA